MQGMDLHRVLGKTNIVKDQRYFVLLLPCLWKLMAFLKNNLFRVVHEAEEGLISSN